MAPSGAEFFFFDYVYGSHEYSKRDCGRIHAELYGNRSSAGSDFLGKYAVTFRKSADDKGMVDHSDPGYLSDCDTSLLYRNRKLPAEAGEQKAEESVMTV